MKKDAFYFPHDSNANRDPKLSAFRKRFGFEGIGIWWCLVELMHEQGGQFEKFPGFYEGLAFQLGVDEAKLKQIIFASISEFRLFQEDDTSIWSSRVQANLRERLDKRLKRVEAGRLGGIRSGKKRSKTKQNEATLEANEPKESKGKESKGKERDKDNYLVVPPAAPDGPTPEDLVSLWNGTAHPNLPKVQLMTDKRKRAARARLAENPGKTFWTALMEKVNRSPLLTGQKGEWRCSFDWILSPGNLAKITEGNYDPDSRK